MPGPSFPYASYQRTDDMYKFFIVSETECE